MSFPNSNSTLSALPNPTGPLFKGILDKSQGFPIILSYLKFSLVWPTSLPTRVHLPHRMLGSWWPQGLQRSRKRVLSLLVSDLAREVLQDLQEQEETAVVLTMDSFASLREVIKILLSAIVSQTLNGIPPECIQNKHFAMCSKWQPVYNAITLFIKKKKKKLRGWGCGSVQTVYLPHKVQESIWAPNTG